MSNPILAQYDFLSFVRRGAAADLTNADPLQGALPDRGPLDAELNVHSTADGDARDDTATAKVALYGPGDVVGIDPRHVIGTEPRAGTTNFEPNYLAGIEFDHPDFPWLFTPAAAAGDRLRPWLCLLALAEGEFKLPDSAGPLPVVQVTAPGVLPDLRESWAWAHAQVSGGIGGGEVGAIADAEPGRVLSRLLSPRRLQPLTRYTAFLVPAFDLGVKAGLGEEVPSAPGTQAAPAWEPGGTGMLPIYHRFEFQTSDDGDFESLVRRLVPRKLPAEVGMRQMLVDRPGWGVRSAGGPLGLGGALRSVETEDTKWEGADREAFQADVTELVDEAAAPLDDPEHDPVVVPPLYGRWHAARATVSAADTGWLGGLNADPRPRAGAGFGTRVVLSERTQLMASAWRQVQGVEAANQLIRQAQLAVKASTQVLVKHFASAPSEVLLTLTEPLHKRLLASPRTVKATIAATALPTRALEPTFRRIASPSGPIMRRGRGGGGRGLLRRLARGELAPAPPLRNPDGFESLEELGQAAAGPVGVPALLRPLCGRHRLVAIAAVVLAIAIVLIGLLIGLFGPALVLALLVAALLLALARWLRERCGAGGESLDFGDLRPEAVAEVPPRPDFTVEVEGVEVGGTGGAPGADSPAAAGLRHALETLGAGLPRPHEEPDKPGADIGGLAGGVIGKLDPKDTIGARVEATVSVVERGGGVVHWDEPLDEIMAAPEFPQPMYEPLRDLSQDYLLPGVELVPADTLGLLKENHAFIEAYMVGLNHEMGRELLWNNYPTDQRGSYFRQFWDVRGYVRQPTDPADPEALRELLKDIPRIHRWPLAAPLGEHRNRPVTGGDRLVLLVRGELLKRYPNAVVYAGKAVWNASEHRHDLGDAEKHPLYSGTLSPDLTFFGFDLTKEEALGNTKDHNDPDQGWFFVFQQQPGEPRFGLEPPPEGGFANPKIEKWNDLSWANLVAGESELDALQNLPVAGSLHGTVAIEETAENPGDKANKWGADAAQLAFIALRRPVRVAVHAETMLPH